MAQKTSYKKSPKAETALQNTKLQYVADVIENHFSSEDISLIKQGHHGHLYKKLGAHPVERSGQKGVYFAVWAPNAKSVAVIGDFNQWDKETHFLQSRKDSSGLWEGFIPQLKVGDYYKYFITSRLNNYAEEKIDPFAFSTEVPPKTASIVTDLEYQWNDAQWMASRTSDYTRKPMSVYEVHLGSWMKTKSGRFFELS
jgi:1,4-alpha-glucan branching enzyme